MGLDNKYLVEFNNGDEVIVRAEHVNLAKRIARDFRVMEIFGDRYHMPYYKVLRLKEKELKVNKVTVIEES